MSQKSTIRRAALGSRAQHREHALQSVRRQIHLWHVGAQESLKAQNAQFHKDKFTICGSRHVSQCERSSKISNRLPNPFHLHGHAQTWSVRWHLQLQAARARSLLHPQPAAPSPAHSTPGKMCQQRSPAAPQERLTTTSLAVLYPYFPQVFEFKQRQMMLLTWKDHLCSTPETQAQFWKDGDRQEK